MEKKTVINSVDVMQYIQNLESENKSLKEQVASLEKKVSDMKHTCKNAAYQQAEISSQLKVLSEQLTTIAKTNNGGPLTQADRLSVQPLSDVLCTKPAKELTPAQIAAYEKRKADTAERKRKEARSEAIKAAWTPERRAQQAELMKERRAKQLAESSNEVNN